ncbi:fumarylacetoacetate hydrolase family protein [Pontibacter chitinilyticus]|uniref:fumarylacetoacetate hydrolase family protein n=1 Tax=Pontibacter chitinilyticus TaxID=2674989 RepID=UPI003219489A
MVKANDPSLHSWIEIAATSHFPIQNLPFGIFQTEDRDPRVGVAIGECILDLCVVAQHNMFELIDLDPNVFHRSSLNDFISLGRPVWRAVRNRVSELLRTSNEEICGNSDLIRECLIKQSDAQLLLPIPIADGILESSTGFHSGSKTLWQNEHISQHLRNSESATLPSPPTFTGDGIKLQHPEMEISSPHIQVPPSAPCQQLDFEVSIGLIINKAESAPEAITAEADASVFGFVVVNKWLVKDASAGAGSTTAMAVSPWVVTLDALEPFKVKAPEQTQKPLLEDVGSYYYDLKLEVQLQSENELENSLCSIPYKYTSSNLYKSLTSQSSIGSHLPGSRLIPSSENAYTALPALPPPSASPTMATERNQMLHTKEADTVVVRCYGERNGISIGFGEVRTRVLQKIV